MCWGVREVLGEHTGLRLAWKGLGVGRSGIMLTSSDTGKVSQPGLNLWVKGRTRTPCISMLCQVTPPCKLQLGHRVWFSQFLTRASHGEEREVWSHGTKMYSNASKVCYSERSDAPPPHTYVPRSKAAGGRHHEHLLVICWAVQSQACRPGFTRVHSVWDQRCAHPAVDVSQRTVKKAPFKQTPAAHKSNVGQVSAAIATSLAGVKHREACWPVWSEVRLSGQGLGTVQGKLCTRVLCVCEAHKPVSPPNYEQLSLDWAP